MIEEALYDRLSTDSNITDKLGASDNIFPNQASREVNEPYIVFEIQTREPDHIKNSAPTVDFVEVDVRIFAKSYDSASGSNILDIHKAIRDRLEYYKGTNSGIDIDRIQLNDSQDDYDDTSELHEREDTYRIRYYRP